MNSTLLDVFYNCLIKEFALGSVDCFFKYNMRFNTRIIEENVEVFGNSDDNTDLLIPTLIINDKQEFNYLLEKYVEMSLMFYDDECFVEEVKDSNYFDNDLGISKEKVIMTLLWSNANYEDFNDPCTFLKKRISFFELGDMEKYLNKQIVATSEVMDADIEVVIVKNKLESETPYSLVVGLLDTKTGRKIYEFPRSYFGVFNNEGYVYAIQNSRDRFVDLECVKKIDRVLYKVNEGLDVENDTYLNYGVGNLKDVTPNALVAANILVGLFKENGIFKVIVPSILIVRWNAKMILLEKQRNIGNRKNEDIENDYNKYLYLQSNLTEKFLRVFRRIGYHHSSIMVSSYPTDFGSSLELSIFNIIDVCNNELLAETYFLEENKRKLK